MDKQANSTRPREILPAQTQNVQAVEAERTDKQQAHGLFKMEGPVIDLQHAAVLLDYFAFDLFGKISSEGRDDNVEITMAAYEVDALLFSVSEVLKRARQVRSLWSEAWEGKAVSE